MIENVRAFFNSGSPTAEIVLATPVVRPGEEIRGCVRVQGGAEELLIGRVGVGLWIEGSQEPRYQGKTKVDSWAAGLPRVVVGQDVWLPANQPLDFPFRLALPWTTPFTAVGTALLPVSAEVWTELMVHDALDPSIRHPMVIQPLPSQNRVLDAFGQLGATFFMGDILRAPVSGVPDDLVAMLEFMPLPRYPQLIEVGVGFVADPWHLRVILTAKKYRRWLQPDSAVIGDFYMRHEAVWQVDWAAAIDRCLAYAAVR